MNKLHIALIVAVLAVVLYLSTLSTAAMQSLQSGFMSIFSPFLRTSTAVQENIGSVGQRLKTLDELEVENRQLLTENNQIGRAHV